MSTWNHRVVHSRHGVLGGEPGELEDVYEFAEVHYNDAGLPVAYGSPFMHGEKLEDLKWVVEKLEAALLKPVVEADEIMANGRRDG